MADRDNKLPVPAARRAVINRDEHQALPVPVHPGGVIDTIITGFRADLWGHFERKRERAITAYAKSLDATEGAAQSYKRLMRTLDEVEDLPNILEEDQRTRQHERARSEHQRLMEEQRWARERRQAEFQDLAAQREVEAAFHAADKDATENRRWAEAAEEVSDEEVQRQYLEAVTRRIDQQIKHLRAEDALSQRSSGGSARPTTSPGMIAALIAILESELDHHRQRNVSPDVVQAIEQAILNAISRLNAEQRKK